jgi:hypothetical protein
MMETEQMAAIADHRQGGASLARMVGAADLDEPVTVMALRRVLLEFPENAHVRIEGRARGAGVTITAEWGGQR